MRKVFADTQYWVALFNPREQSHQAAKSTSQSLGHAQIVTSEMVLVEVLNLFAKKGPYLRQAACKSVDAINRDPNVIVVRLASVLFQRAFDLYKDRPDKGWSLTDCSSILIMQDQGINDVLSEDADFTQAGFNALLAPRP